VSRSVPYRSAMAPDPGATGAVAYAARPAVRPCCPSITRVPSARFTEAGTARTSRNTLHNQQPTTDNQRRPPWLSIKTRPSYYPDRSCDPSRTAATVAGALAVVVGAWGGIAPYVGNALHYSADGSATWVWNLQHGLLSLLPGAIAVIAGALLIISAWVRREEASALHTFGLAVATALLGLSAVWFLIGSSVWPIYFTSRVLVSASPVRNFANLGGTYVAEGFILAVLAGVAGTWAVRSLSGRSDQGLR